MADVGHLVAGRFRIVRSLGAGGMGRVWLADDRARHRRVAIKKCALPEGLTAAEQRLVRGWTVREIRAVARVRHRAVVRIHAVLTGDDEPWIVMEYVPSRSLLELIRAEGALPAGRVAGIGLAVLGALGAARRRGVLHLDVKPSNVLVADDGRVLLTDFGPVVTEAGVAALSRAGVILGSPKYVAPERLVGGVSTERSDLWSLGATLYHAWEGRPPYARESTTGTLQALISGGLPDPPRRGGPLGAVLEGLLQRDPAERMSAAEAEERLRRVVPGHPPVATGTVRSRVAAVAAALAVLGGVGAVLGADRLPGPEAREASRTQAGATVPAVRLSPRPFVLPPGFRWWTDRGGFVVAVPRGWPKGRLSSGRVSLRVSTWEEPEAVPALIRRERDSAPPGYRRIRIEALPVPPDAVWEYTFEHPAAGPMRAIERIVARGGRTFRVEWRAPSRLWAAELPKLEVIVASLRPLDGT